MLLALLLGATALTEGTDMKYVRLHPCDPDGH